MTTDPGRFHVWMMAARPKTLPAAAAPVLIGMGLAAHHATLRPLPALAALVGALLIQIGTNLANDYYDFVRGGDTEDRVGPTRVTQAGLVEPAAVFRAMLLVLGVAFLLGIYLVWVGGWPIVVIGLASLVCAVAYTGGPFPLAYHGLGDVFVFVFFGLVAVGGTYWVQALAWPPDALLAGAGVGALSTAILVANNLRDIETDRVAHKRTLAVRMGERATRVQYTLMLTVGAAAPVVGVLGFGWPPTALIALGGLLLAASPTRLIWTGQGGALLPALAGTAKVVALYGVLLAIGLAWGGA